MRKTVIFAITSAATVLLGLGSLLAAPVAQAAGQLPNPEVCDNKDHPPTDAVTQGACIVLARKKGNCVACHEIAGAQAFGNVAPALVSIKQRYPDRAKLREQIWDASKANPNTVMPPFGKNMILSPEEIDKVVDFLLTL
ncbi:MAG: sulfur oxidation c-type cytochrome SoxX [Sulfuricaulis sp.]